MEFKVKDVAALLHGTVEGDENIIINNVSKIEEGKPNTLAFLSNPKYEQYIYTTQASVVLVNQDFKPSHDIPCTLIRVPSAYEAIAKLLQMYEQMRPQPVGIEQPSFIHETATVGDKLYLGAFAYIGKKAKIGNNVKIYPQAYIGDNVTIGDNTTINSGVKIYKDCAVGSKCIIHAGTVIGADGFGFAPSNSGYDKIPQIGNVVIEDNVEIGANTCVDRAMMGSTRIKQGVKLDNLIQVGHNVVIGENTVMAAQVGVAGSAKIGGQCMIGGQVGIAGHLTVHDGARIAAQSGIGHEVKPNATLMGSPAFDFNTYQRAYVLFRKLPDLYNRLCNIEKELKKD